MNKEQIAELLKRYEKGTLTEKELRLLQHWFAKSSEPAATDSIDEDYLAIQRQMWAKINKTVVTDYKVISKRTPKLWSRIAAAIAIVFCIGLGYSIYLGRTTEGFRLARDYKNDITPGKNTATLISSNGKAIVLSEAQTGVTINSTTLAYNDGTTIDPSALGITDRDSRSLQISTPRGGTYSIILQDGTKVWLNADSKLEFLTDYRNKLQRIVKLIGEGYFEVKKDTKRPFIVATKGQRTQVLGTHFNISAYPGEGIRTTLLEGSVRVASLALPPASSLEKRSDEGFASQSPSGFSSAELAKGSVLGDAVTLKPNQQSLVRESSGISVKEVDVNEAVAWRNGDFVFTKQSLANIMQSIARWYDVQVKYDANVDVNQTFSVLVSRQKNISQILLSLETTGKVKFRIDGQTVQVSK